MKYILSIALAVSIFVISCSDMKKGNEQDGKAKHFSTAAEAANAAKQDMLEAAEKVDFAINKEKLRSSSPGLPIGAHDVIWDSLIKADSTTVFEALIGLEKATVVPLVNGNEVVTVVFLEHKKDGYTISALGEKQVSSELDMISKADASMAQAKIKIYDIPNLQAIVYAVTKGSTTAYYTSYNNNSIRQAMDANKLIKVLATDAVDFQKKFGEELKKGNLVR